MQSKLIVCFIMILFVFMNSACTQENQRKEVGQEGLVEITAGHSKYYSEYKLASQLIQENKISEAIPIYLRLCKIEDEPQKTYCYTGLGSAYLRANDYNKAIANYNISLSLNSKNIQSYVGLGSTYYYMNAYKKAIYYYNIAKEIDISNSNSFWGLAISYDALGINDSAKINARRFIELEPNSIYRELADSILLK